MFNSFHKKKFTATNLSCQCFLGRKSKFVRTNNDFFSGSLSLGQNVRLRTRCPVPSGVLYCSRMRSNDKKEL